MHQADFVEEVKKISAADPRYDLGAYLFVREALDFTVKRLKKPTRGPSRHVSGRELLDGIRSYALDQYGPMALTVLATWGLKSTEDCGEIVFNLVNAGVLGKTDSDTKQDFAKGYDFHEAFAKPFLPPEKPRRQQLLRLKGVHARRPTPERNG